jgi:hypothetical protein
MLAGVSGIIAVPVVVVTTGSDMNALLLETVLVDIACLH